MRSTTTHKKETLSRDSSSHVIGGFERILDAKKIAFPWRKCASVVGPAIIRLLEETLSNGNHPARVRKFASVESKQVDQQLRDALLVERCPTFPQTVNVIKEPVYTPKESKAGSLNTAHNRKIRQLRLTKLRDH